MSSSRREFLKRGTLVALAAGVPLSLTEKASAAGLTAASRESDLSLAAFKSQLDTTFLINNKGSKLKVKLVDVTNLASQKQTRAGKEGFSLVFQGPRENVLQQNTYVIEHERLGKFSFLLVPIKLKEETGRSYEAVINRLYP